MQRLRSPSRRVLALTSALTMALGMVGCGGGGSSSSAGPTISELRGFWSGVTGANQGSVVSLGDASMWLVEEANDVPVAVTKATWSASASSISGAGRRVVVATGEGSNVSLNVSAIGAGASLSGTLNGAAFSWAYSSAGVGSLTSASLQGTWTGQFNQGTLALTWTISSTGKITGSSTTGCVYDGALGDRTDNLKVVDLKVSENCAGTVKPLTGVGTVDATGKLASFPYMADNGSAAGVFRLTKQ